MASIFEELMSANFALTESARPVARSARKVNEHKKISTKNIKVESRRIFEEADYDELDQEFANEPSEENPDEVVLVIDPELPSDEEVPENAAEDMVGDLVYKCPICGSNYVCDCDAAMGEGIEVDDNGVPVECPICGDDAEQILVGEISPAEGAGEEVDPELLDAEGPEEEEEITEEDEFLDDEDEFPEDEVVDESLNELFGKKKKKEIYTVSVKEDDGSWTPIHEFDNKSDAVKFKDDYEKDHPGAKYVVHTGKTFESLSEDFDDEEGIEDCEECDDALELDAPVEAPSAPAVEEPEAPAVVVNNSNVELFFDDSKFESLMTQIIKENYKGAPKFKTTRCSTSKGQLKLEYFVREGRKVTKGVLVGEGFDKTSRKMTIKFVDKGAFTESFAKHPSFIVECVRVRNAVTPLSVKYNYKVKVNESLYRVSGKVGK